MAEPLTNSKALVVPVGGATNQAVADIHDIKPPVPLAGSLMWVWWLLAAALAIAAYYWWRTRRRPAAAAAAAVVPPHVRAKQRLQLALGLISDPRLFCIEVSTALRVYLEERFELHAPERTTEEFLFELQSASQLLLDQKAALREFLEQCDLVKFAKFEPPEDELRRLHEAALRLIDETQFEPVAA